MNKLFFFILGVVLYFPAWIFKSGLKVEESFFSLILFLIMPLIIHLWILKKYQKDLNEKFLFFYISLIFVYSLDQNYGVMSSVDIIPNIFNIKPYPLYIYVTAFLLLIFVFVIIFIFIYNLKFNGIKIVFAFTIVSLFVNLFDNRNFYFFETNFYKGKNLQSKIKTTKHKTLIILLDEMSGIESFESNHVSGKIAKNTIQNFFNKWNFVSYPNAYSLHQSSATAIPLLLNFEYDFSKMEFYKEEYVHEKKGKFINMNEKYFLSDNELKENKFFDTFDGNKITVFQSMSINFCNNKKVNNCFQYNPFKTDYTYLNGVKNKKLSRIISLWKLQGSITSNFIWRVLRINFIDNTLEPYGEKMTIDSLLSDINNYVLYDDSDLIFVHTLFSHNPYGFDEKCGYDGSRSMIQHKKNIEWKINQNNIERVCVVNKLDKLFEMFKKGNVWSQLDVLVLSDHGSRISKENFENSYLSSIFAKKSNNNNPNIIYDKLSTQFLFSKYLNSKHIE